MKFFYRIFLLIAVVFFASCMETESPDQRNPEEVVEAFFEAMANNDIATLKKLTTPDSRTFVDALSAASGNSEDMLSSIYDRSSMKIGVAEIEGYNAKVPVMETSTESVVTYELQKINGNWKIAFNESFFNNVMNEALRNDSTYEGDLPADSSKIQKNMERETELIESMDTDSLKKALEAELENN